MPSLGPGAVADPREGGFTVGLGPFAVAVAGPADLVPALAHRWSAPPPDDPVQRWSYRVHRSDDDGRVELREGGDAFAQLAAADPAAIVHALAERVRVRALDHLARWGWVTLPGRVSTGPTGRRLLLDDDDPGVVLARDGEVLPLAWPPGRPVPPDGRGRLAAVVLAGRPPGPVARPEAIAAVAAAARGPVPGGARTVLREAVALLRGVDVVGG